MLFAVGPFLAPALIPSIQIGGLAQLIFMIIGVLSLIVLAILVVITKLYVRVGANEALVRTGMRGRKVVLDGGIIIVPYMHKYLTINLETMRLDVPRVGPDALITQDKLRADIQAEFYIRVAPNEEDVTNAARSLGERTTDPSKVMELVIEKLISALRTVAAKSDLFDLNSKREEFGKGVKEAVESELTHNGLTLETVTISKLDQTRVEQFAKDNVFDDQGRRRVAEIVQKARVDTNELTRNAEAAIAAKDVETRKTILALQLDKERAEAEQARDVKNAKAEAERVAASFQLEQEQAVAIRDVEKNRATQLAEVKREQDVETAEKQKQVAIIDAEKKREIADRAREEAVRVAEVQRDKAQSVAEREKETAIAAKEEERAKAEAARLAAEALREKNAQEVKTVEVVQTAEREKQQQVIAATAAAEKMFVTQQRTADAKAYETEKLAEGKMKAAEADYAAKVKAAEADKVALSRHAEGLEAEQMVPINVKKAQVDVDRSQQLIAVQVNEGQVEVDRKSVSVLDAKVAVQRKELEQKEQFGRAGIDLQVRLAEIQANKEVRIAQAQALAQMLSNAKMTIFGSPETAAEMTRKFSDTMGVANSLNGFFAGLTDGSPAKEAVDRVLGVGTGLVEALASWLKKERSMTMDDAMQMAKEMARGMTEDAVKALIGAGKAAAPAAVAPAPATGRNPGK